MYSSKTASVEPSQTATVYNDFITIHTLKAILKMISHAVLFVSMCICVLVCTCWYVESTYLYRGVCIYEQVHVEVRYQPGVL